jgi:[ribosomal protein S5]-alanine N-acetyltransferase
MRPPERILTPRLLLRKPFLKDAQLVFSQYAQDPRVTKYLVWRPHRSIDDTVVFLSACLENWGGHHDFSWVIESKATDTLMGMIGLRLEQTSASLGFVLAMPFWNQGLMTEAVAALADWALNQESIFRVWAVCDTENVPSARVLEKAGMVCEGVLRRWTVLPNISGKPRDCFCYAKTR